MLRKVRIVKSAPKARTGYQVQGSLANDVPAFGGADYNAYIGTSKPEVSKTMKAVPRQIANLEAEGGETVVGNLDGSKMPSFKTIVGPRHSSGGVPLLLPEDSFIFSDTKAMKIADPKMLDMFGVKPKKGGYTPAELSKKYDINNYRKILQDPNSDKIARTTAEIMIKNYVMKLGALALAQESKKAFPQGIPLIARPYMEAMGLRDEDLIPELAMQQEQQMPQQEVEEVEEEFPQQMPDGQPIAQPQPMPQQMPEPGMAPMAQYGMTMGGYDMPFYDIPEAEYGMPMGTGMSQNYMGRRKFIHQDGGESNFVVLKPDGTPLNTDPNYIPPSIPYIPDDVLPFYRLMNAPEGSLQEASQEELDALNAAYPPEQGERTIPHNRYGGIPKAAYGMRTGMSQSYMGNPRYADGGDLPIAIDGTPRPKTATKVDPEAYKKSTWETRKDEQGEYKYNQTRGGVEGRKEYERQRAPSGGSNPNLINDLCRNMKTKGSRHYGKTAAEVLAYAGYKPGTSLYDKHIITLKECEQKGEIIEEKAIYTEQKPPQDDCPCKDKDGKAIPGVFAKKDKDGNCLPETCESSCECPKPDGTGTYDPGKDVNGNCKECTKEDPDDKSITTTSPGEAEWWLQDTVNAAGAFGDLMGIRKRMPWEPRVDLEEPRPTFLDPTRELAAQSEQANIAAQASAQFAGPQALGARLSAIQGQGAAQAANTLSQINNQNVNIANQFEGQQVGIRNQEQLMNQQLAGRLYDKNTIADQQFQNAKRAGRANMAQAYNTAVTNKWKTDALNQMYPDYQVSPASGGRVKFTGQPKDAVATKPEMTMEEYIAANKGTDKDLLREMVRIKYGKGKYGGATMFRDGGYAYAVFPYGDY